MLDARHIRAGVSGHLIVPGKVEPQRPQDGIRKRAGSTRGGQNPRLAEMFEGDPIQRLTDVLRAARVSAAEPGYAGRFPAKSKDRSWISTREVDNRCVEPKSVRGSGLLQRPDILGGRSLHEQR